MKKISLLICSILVLQHVSYAQDLRIPVKFQKNEGFLGAVNLNQEGFAISLGKRILRYNTSSELIWESSIPSVKNRGSNRYLLASPDASFIYVAEVPKSIYNPKYTHTFTSISKSGEAKTFEISGNDDFGKSLQTVFADEDYVYYLATENEHELNDRKKLSEKLILNRFSIANAEYNKFELDLPELTDGDHTTFWYYIGQKGQNKYLVSKYNEKKSASSMYTIVAIDQNGSVIKQMKIKMALESRFLRPALYAEESFKNFGIAKNLNYYPKTRREGRANELRHGSGNINGETKTIIEREEYTDYNEITIGGFSSIVYDQEADAFYAYGLFGPTPFQKIGARYDGFYVHKYDGEGKEIWKLVEQAPEELIKEVHFHKHAPPRDRNLGFKMLPNGSLNLTISFYTRLFNFEISPEGKTISHRMKNKVHYNLDHNIYLSNSGLETNSYIDGLKRKSAWKFSTADLTHVRNRKFKNMLLMVSNSLPSIHGEFLFEYYPKKDKIEILFFGYKEQGSI